MSDYSAFVPKVHFDLIPIKNLVSNQKYQRNLSLKHIERASADFDLYQINPVKVSKRDGMYYVFNGQHTIEIVALVSGSRETPVWCMIYDDLAYEHEADIFANQMKHVKSLQPYEIFQANIEAGNDEQLIIQALVDSFGLKISQTRAPGNIIAVSALENIYEKYGYQVLSRTLRLCIGAWEGDANSFAASILNGIAKLVVVYGDTLDDAVFKEKVGGVSIKTLTRTAKDRRPGFLGYAEAMVIIYNGKKRNSPYRLRQNRLYGKETFLNEDQDDTEEDYLEEDDEEGES